MPTGSWRAGERDLLMGDTISVGVNLLWLRPGRVGGSEEYAVRLLAAIDFDAPVRLTLFAQPGFSGAHPRLAERHEVVTSPVGRGRPLRVLSENTWLADQCRRRRPNLVHHFGGTVPLIGNRPSIVTIHDVQPLEFPERFGVVKRSYLRMMLPWSVRRAEAVVTVSGFCRDRLVDHLGVDPRRVRVLPAPVLASTEASANSRLTAPPLVAANPGGVEPAPGVSTSARPPLVADLSRPFVLYPAITYPHKNHAVLLRALARLAGRGLEVDVVVTGIPGPLDGELDRLADALGLGERWHRLGRIPAGVLEGLYRQALAVVFPSRYEGYGLPVVEAMIRGCPVMAADAGSLPEVVGSGGYLVDPDDDASWATAIESLLLDPRARRNLVEAGRSRAQELAGLDPAAELCALYFEVAG
ncbi:glycosyltransferase family 4 protein [Candidatus Poriferisocius sp.]|uniref:glycosyltransferase family 4 protein n=1 Tax=Candidatus Poriferisocius sp. TaxID=3101276 RepID=UPI003B0256E2